MGIIDSAVFTPFVTTLVTVLVTAIIAGSIAIIRIGRCRA